MTSSSRVTAAALIYVIHLTAVLALAPPSPGQQQKKCGLYGQAPCTFVPAPPGITPKCASPGKTYCEHNDDYPTFLIQQLVDRLGFKRILASEERVQFNVNRQGTQGHYFYGPEMQNVAYGLLLNSKPIPLDGYIYDPPKQQQHSQNSITIAYIQKAPSSSPVPQPIYIPKPQQSFNFNSYVRPQVVHEVQTTSTVQGYVYPRPVTQYSPAEWLKRFARDLSEKRTSTKISTVHKSPNPNDLIPTPFRLPPELEIRPSPFRPAAAVFGLLMNDTAYHDSLVRSRQKRQISDGRTQLCQTREMFVTPQAALNTKGNWMYVVNHEDSRQLVKAEICSSKECSNLCNLPNGYNSRCEQKFSQKRLLTLDSDGQSLYVDTYWFPSCCVCTLATNN
ncbi:protein spaetzle 5 [Wyeomyia smithii]|uniref:protein spaetzle 5 n=1 Tax=Wyeomyia smithii TaxID=174621 RepID=UPI002467CDBC|nr:protein spaetzle 5 [Wyeomyia smithii]XP_055536367.1 protein spaetzle 5 [Wyeomyia smithii]XP_055536368.1 protein spaetzle 5 [Wyeomyia smithii]XP_055536369.1 protein spaetzle 5 [Wyeomyia smithii]XP_055536370.1 protein spaetzle 5 [Wyeomyia smithii]XP_055536371.1 protein spaetzle 5 [Wyeomyia smithii]